MAVFARFSPGFLVVGFLLVLSACVSPPLAPGPEGYLDVMGGFPSFGLGASPEEIARRGFFQSSKPLGSPPASVAAILDGERPTLRLTTPADDVVLGRTIEAPLLATPFLSWRWRREDQGKEDAAISLLIGFSGGGGPLASESPSLPPYDRALVIAWTAKPPDATTLSVRGPYARYVAEVGSGGGTWQEHAVDLSDLHREFWPSIQSLAVRITFIAVAARRGKSKTVNYVADLFLTH